MNKIIFLDIDGVLNRHQSHPILRYCSIDKDLAENFNKLLWYTDSYFVLSSAWRYLHLGGSMTLEGLKNLLLSHWVDGTRLIGVTDKDEACRMIDPNFTFSRGERIQHWIDQALDNKIIDAVYKYLVIDDMNLGISECGHPFIQTVSSKGFTDNDLATAIEMLS